MKVFYIDPAGRVADSIPAFPDGYKIAVLDALVARILCTDDSYKHMPVEGQVVVVTPLVLDNHEQMAVVRIQIK